MHFGSFDFSAYIPEIIASFVELFIFICLDLHAFGVSVDVCGCAIWALLEKATQITAIEFKAPTSRVYKKYVYNSFLVKMRIDFRPVALF